MPSAFDGYLPPSWDNFPTCPKCGSGAVMEPGKLKGRPVGSGLELECVACRYRGKNADFKGP